MTLLSATDLTRVYPVRVGLCRRKVPLFAVSEVSFGIASIPSVMVQGTFDGRSIIFIHSTPLLLR